MRNISMQIMLLNLSISKYLQNAVSQMKHPAN